MELDFRDGLLVFQLAQLDSDSARDEARAEMRAAGMGAGDISRAFKQARALRELIDTRITAAANELREQIAARAAKQSKGT